MTFDEQLLRDVLISEYLWNRAQVADLLATLRRAARKKAN